MPIEFNPAVGSVRFGGFSTEMERARVGIDEVRNSLYPEDALSMLGALDGVEGGDEFRKQTDKLDAKELVDREEAFVLRFYQVVQQSLPVLESLGIRNIESFLDTRLKSFSGFPLRDEIALYIEDQDVNLGAKDLIELLSVYNEVKAGEGQQAARIKKAAAEVTDDPGKRKQLEREMDYMWTNSADLVKTAIEGISLGAIAKMSSDEAREVAGKLSGKHTPAVPDVIAGPLLAKSGAQLEGNLLARLGGLFPGLKEYVPAGALKG